MITDSENKNKEQWPENKTIIEKYLHTFRHSKQSQATRSSCLNYFFKPKYFGYSEHVFDIDTDILIDYFDYLKHLKTISLETKKTKWTLLISFIKFSMEYYRKYKFIVVIPKHSIKWSTKNKSPKSNVDVFLTIEEISKILNYLKKINFKYYLIFRLFAESGPRKGGAINLDYDQVFLEERYIDTDEKNRRNVYYISEELRNYFKIYLQERRLIPTGTKAFFLSPQLKRFSNRPFNLFLESFRKKIGINKNVTCQVFRRSLNLLRFKMGCDDRIMRILLNQKVKGVNFNNYVKNGLSNKEFLEYFNIWNPFKEIQL